MTIVETQQPASIAVCVELSGLVQGVGMRPFVARLANELGLFGSVRNDGHGVAIHIEGTSQNLERFIAELRIRLPAIARVDRISQSAVELTDATNFTIGESPESGVIATRIPPDVCMCDSCRSEVLTSSDRRYQYPFTTCTSCGPRYSLIETMPFDRVHTAMPSFAMCPACDQEYRDAEDRRCHAQTNCCPVCGPQISFNVGRNWTEPMKEAPARAKTPEFRSHLTPTPATRSQNRNDNIRDAAAAIRQGLIVGLKGVGGYQLVCDATSVGAVQRLRDKKRRSQKPFAVMVSSVDEARNYANPNGVDETVLTSPENPIVLLHCKGLLPPQISPNLNQVGLMLPTSPLHLLLLQEFGGPCVVTSGNVDGEPLAYCQEAAQEELRNIADVWLHHNRDIVRPIDDSVVRVIDQQPVSIRAARGIAPLSLAVQASSPILAVGGQQKVALALSTGQQAVLGPHIGDMNGVASRERFVESVDSLCQLYEVTPTVIAHDLHPDYFTSRWANDQHKQTIAVQHHHAHVVAGMLEHDWLDDEVLGVAFDGTGFGPDKTIWGGEFLLCTAKSYRRVARLRPFPLVGGDRAIREPWRVAGALLHEADLETFFRRKNDLPLSEHRSLFPLTSSMGRLFDGVASLLLDIDQVSYEGEAAMRLEAICDLRANGRYDLPIVSAEIDQLDWRPMMRKIVGDLRAGIPIGTIAMRFTRGVAIATQQVCRRFADHRVVLTGGCFQNAVLTHETVLALKDRPCPVGVPGRIPPNDGGLAAGQLAVAAATLRKLSNLKGAV